MENDLITPDLVIADIMQRWPASIKLFLEHGMACVGCSLSVFDTLADALQVYNIPPEEILPHLKRSTLLRQNNPGEEMALVLLESPYAGDLETNIKFARACMRDSLDRGEAPFAMHLLYTQEGILDDAVPGQRELGIAAGLAWGRHADKTVVYTNLGITPGMQIGIQTAERDGRQVEYRELDGWDFRLENTGSGVG